MSDIKTRLRIKCNQALPSPEDGCEDLVDDLLPNEGHQLMRSGMRTSYGPSHSNPHIEWYSDLGHGHNDYAEMHNQIYGLAEKYVGKPYDQAYSELVHRGLADREYYCYCYGTGRDMWKSLFEGRWRYFDVVDGLIVKVRELAPKCKDIVIHNWLSTPGYKVRKDYWESARSVLLPLLGWESYWSFYSAEMVSKKTLERLIRHVTSCKSQDWLDQQLNNIKKFRLPTTGAYRFDPLLLGVWGKLFTPVWEKSTTVYSYGSKEYWQYKAQQKKLRSKRIKEARNPDRSSYDEKLRIDKRERKLKNKFNLVG